MQSDFCIGVIFIIKKPTASRFVEAIGFFQLNIK